MRDGKRFDDLIAGRSSRRSFVGKLGAAAALAGVAGTRASAQTTTYADNDYLNFLLNLEYLEAELYTVASTGMTLSQYGTTVSGGTGTAGTTTGGSQITFGSNSAMQNVVLELASDEREHVALLQNMIGPLAVAKPAINLNALGFGFGSVNDFLRLARILEDIGLSAYASVVASFQTRTNATLVARIMGIEGEHAGNIRLMIAQAGISTTPPIDGADHLPPPSGSQYFSTDSNGLVELRTPQQALYLAYGNTGTSTLTLGGFFPGGVNGNIYTSGSAAATTDGASITINPNPIIVSSGQDGVATISWNAPSASLIQVRIGSPNGALFTDNFPTGQMQTGAWVTNGMTFYLQDVSNGKPLTSANTLATAVATVQVS